MTDEDRDDRDERDEAAESESGATKATSKETTKATGTEPEAEGLAARLIAQWVQLREERQEQLASPVPLATGPQRPTHIPAGVELAASWAWRFLVIVAAAAAIGWAVGYLAIIVVPLVIAMLITALVGPVVGVLQRRLHLPRGLAALFTLLGVIAVVVLALVFATRQVAAGSQDMADQVVDLIDEITHWLKTGPFHLSDSQIDAWLDEARRWLTDFAQQGNPVGRIFEVGSIAADIVAGLFIVLFSTYFFLAEGSRIWQWIVRLNPRAARPRVNSSGAVAWVSLTQFIRATVVVAAVDALGIMLAAAILQVPFVLAIGVLVFLGAFVPLVGATLTGTVAVLIALIDQGVVVALLMLGAVVLVQQLESHLLQPFLMGKWVAVHPLGVLLAIATGIVVAGIPGALVAVPSVAALNAVVLHLNSGPPAAPPDEPEPPDAPDELAPTREGTQNSHD